MDESSFVGLKGVAPFANSDENIAFFDAKQDVLGKDGVQCKVLRKVEK